MREAEPHSLIHHRTIEVNCEAPDDAYLDWRLGAYDRVDRSRSSRHAARETARSDTPDSGIPAPRSKARSQPQQAPASTNLAAPRAIRNFP